MPSFGLCGPSYTSQSRNAADQLCMNWYPENTEGEGQSPVVLYPTPGLEIFCQLTDTPVRGEIKVNNRFFAVGGSEFQEVFSDGTKTVYGTLINDSKLVSMAGGTTQILIASGGNCYVFDLATNAFSLIPVGTLLGNVSFVGYADGYFVALLKDSNQFQWSELLNALVWDPTDTAKVSVFTGNVLSMIVDHRELWFFGERQTQVYGDVGPPQVFDVIPGGFIEAGIFAPNSPVRLDNSLFWLGGDERGAGVVWRAQGYTPQRVSNHAVEFAIQGYLTRFGPAGMNDAIGYSYQDQGHAFYVLYFPTANATWVYDAATGMWHERGFWKSVNAVFTAHRSQCHTFSFGKHLVGDWASNTIYNMNISLLDDFGNPIRRVRRAPHISNEQKWMFYSQLQVYLESGLGPTPPLPSPVTDPQQHVLEAPAGGLWAVSVNDSGLLLSTFLTEGTPETIYLNDIVDADKTWKVGVDDTGLLTTELVTFDVNNPSTLLFGTMVLNKLASLSVTTGLLQTSIISDTDPAGRDPMINLRWSNDGGHTWSNEYSVGAGKAGEFTKRVMFRRLGRSRNRTFEISVSDPIPWRIVSDDLQVQPGTGA